MIIEFLFNKLITVKDMVLEFTKKFLVKKKEVKTLKHAIDSQDIYLINKIFTQGRSLQDKKDLPYPLHHAIKYKKNKAAFALVKYDVNFGKNDFGYSACDLAIISKRYKLVKEIILKDGEATTSNLIKLLTYALTHFMESELEYIKKLIEI